MGVKRVLVACLGNVFLGDDGFGVAVADRLARETLPEGTRVVDFGIRGVHLAYELLEPPDLLVVVDATRRDGAPGTLYVIDPSTDAWEGDAPAPDGHTLDVVSVLDLVGRLGGTLPTTRIVGCEPQELDEGMELSEAVENAVTPAVDMIRGLIEERVTT